jgi:hypothetical protein
MIAEHEVMQPEPEQNTKLPSNAAAQSMLAAWHPVVVAFVRAKGNTRKAAEAIGVEHEVLLLELTQHMDDLQAAIRAVSLMDSFDMARKAKLYIELGFDDMKYEDLVKVYTSALQTVERMTAAAQLAPGGNTIYNIAGSLEQKVVQALPPHVQAALMRVNRNDEQPDNNVPQLSDGQDTGTGVQQHYPTIIEAGTDD